MGQRRFVDRFSLDQHNFDQVFAAKLGDKLRRRTQGDDTAVVDHRDAIAQSFRFVHVVRRQKDGSTLGLQTPQDVPQLTSRLGIESRGRLIQKKQFRIADQGQSHGQALALAAGQFADVSVRLFGQRHFRNSRLGIEPPGVEAAKRVLRFPGQSTFPKAEFPAAICRGACRRSSSWLPQRPAEEFPRRRRLAPTSLRGFRWSSSCRRHWGRATRSIHPPELQGRAPSRRRRVGDVRDSVCVNRDREWRRTSTLLLLEAR